MLVRRAITALFLLVFGLPAVLFGGIPYLILIAFFLCFAAWEFVRMFQDVKLAPSGMLVMPGVLAITIARALFPDYDEVLFTAFVLLAMAVHVFAYERGRDQAAVDFAVTVAGLAYIGWIGAYLIDLRSLPNGGWWLMLALAAVWMADTGAYSIGVAYGRHKMTPRLSPGKSWEGFWAGVFTGTLFGGFLAFAYSTWGPLDITIWEGALLGLALSLLTPLGDLGESLFKRQAGLKDSGNLFPGHGGAFDRIDSWLWGAALGYYLIRWFLL